MMPTEEEDFEEMRLILLKQMRLVRNAVLEGDEFANRFLEAGACRRVGDEVEFNQKRFAAIVAEDVAAMVKQVTGGPIQ